MIGLRILARWTLALQEVSLRVSKESHPKVKEDLKLREAIKIVRVALGHKLSKTITITIKTESCITTTDQGQEAKIKTRQRVKDRRELQAKHMPRKRSQWRV